MCVAELHYEPLIGGKRAVAVRALDEWTRLNVQGMQTTGDDNTNEGNIDSMTNTVKHLNEDG